MGSVEHAADLHDGAEAIQYRTLDRGIQYRTLDRSACPHRKTPGALHPVGACDLLPTVVQVGEAVI
jgi:hypothetical protein